MDCDCRAAGADRSGQLPNAFGEWGHEKESLRMDFFHFYHGLNVSHRSVHFGDGAAARTTYLTEDEFGTVDSKKWPRS
jgi:hypothetical protein